MTERTVCEATRLCDRLPCTHPARYLVPYDSSAVCGIHARAYLRCIPLDVFDAFEDTSPQTNPEGTQR